MTGRLSFTVYGLGNPKIALAASTQEINHQPVKNVKEFEHLSAGLKDEVLLASAGRGADFSW